MFGIHNVVNVTTDTSARCCKKLYVINPEQSVTSCVSLFIKFIKHGYRVVCFTKSRRSCELVFNLVSKQISGVASYRGGYLARERRDIEAGLFDVLGLGLCLF